MTQSPELFKSHEQEYSIATWLGVLSIMERVGGIYTSETSCQTRLGQLALGICHDFEQEPDKLLLNVKRWASNGRYDKQKVNALKDLEIINDDTSLNKEFETAYKVFEGDEQQADLLVNPSFGTLIPVAHELALHYEPRIHESIEHKTDVIYAFKHVRRDIDLYIRAYDPRV